jgi:hypothetical protein
MGRTRFDEPFTGYPASRLPFRHTAEPAHMPGSMPPPLGRSRSQRDGQVTTRDVNQDGKHRKE